METEKSPLQQHLKDMLVQLQFFIFQRKYDKALQNINSILQIQSENGAFYFQRAHINYQLERFYDAICDCNSAKKYKFDSLKVSSLLIKCHIENENIETAEDALEQFLQNNAEIKDLFFLKERINKLKTNQQFCLSEKEDVILRELKQKLYNAGAYYDKLKVVNLNSDYRGVIAIKSIKKKQRIVFIPKSQLITLEIAKKNDICLNIINCKVELTSPKHSFIAIFLLEEMCRIDSQWKLYLDILPKDLSSFPINFKSQQLAELLGSTFLFQIKEKVYDLKKDFDLISYTSQKFREKYSFKEFCWARMIVGSRVFGLHIDGVKTQILAPFADMLNHKTPKQTVWNYCQETNGFFIESLFDIPAGEQVFDSYGRKCNSRFLLNYGFVLQNNKDNEVCIKVQIDSNDQNKLKKMEMLKQKSLQPRIFKISINIEENNFFELMGFLRFKNIIDIDTLAVLQRISGIKTSNDPYYPSRTPPISTELELKIWKNFKQICLNLLQAYPNTYEQDLNELKKPNLSFNERNILILRSGEKKILNFYVEVADEIGAVFMEGYKKAREKVAASSDKIWARYVDKILTLMPHEKTKSERQSQMTMLQERLEDYEDEMEIDD